MFASPKVCLILALLAVTFTSTASAQSGEAIALGVYDPTQAFQGASGISREHVFVSWIGFDNVSFRSITRYAQEQARQLMVTVEPFRREGDKVRRISI